MSLPDEEDEYVSDAELDALAIPHHQVQMTGPFWYSCDRTTEDCRPRFANSIAQPFAGLLDQHQPKTKGT